MFTQAQAVRSDNEKLKKNIPLRRALAIVQLHKEYLDIYPPAKRTN